MACFYAVVWEAGKFNTSSSILVFNSKAARSAFPLKLNQRFESISARQKARFEREGKSVRLVLWDASCPAVFRFQTKGKHLLSEG
jgi:hypothetical protein